MKRYVAMQVWGGVVAAALALPAARAQAPARYRVVDLGTAAGAAAGNAINNRGWVTGFVGQAGGAPMATLWVHGRAIALGTLGGPGSDVAWPVKNDFGLVSGVAETATPDPLQESFSCPVFGLFSGNSCAAFAWQNGAMVRLPGLGGNNSIGAGDNNRGQIVGWAEDGQLDPTCDTSAGQYLQFEATLWQQDRAGRWQVNELPPYPGDPDGAATAINDRGEAVGISGTCDVAIGAYSAIHAVLWRAGRAISLGSLGGHGWNTPDAINNQGVVVGFTNQPGDLVQGQLQIKFIAFEWTPGGGMVSLGTLPGANGQPDAMSEATDINNEGQVVGVSYADFGFDDPRAFLYADGHMTALNALIGGASAEWDITSTGGINDRGEIAAQANPVVQGAVDYSIAHAVLLVPAGARR